MTLVLAAGEHKDIAIPVLERSVTVKSSQRRIGQIVTGKRSAVDLKKTGAYVYAADSTTDAWCAAYAVDDQPVKLWTPDDDDRDIKHALKHAETKVAHNAAFERAICAGLMGPRYGWPVPPTKEWRCTMAMALAMALPGQLGDCADALNLPLTKDAEGKRLMLQMAKPRKPRKGEDTFELLWWDDADRRKRLGAYCVQDVEVERMVEQNLLPLRTRELELWHLDQAINDRGIYVDRALCNAALTVVDDAARWLNDELAEITNGLVTKTAAVAQIIAWLALQDVHTESLDKVHVAELLERTDLADPVRRVLDIRAEAAKAAVKKIAALLAGASGDSRARGLLQFHAASTGRWGGRRFQPQNLVRPKNKKAVPGYIEAVSTGSAALVSLYGDPLEIVSDCLRGLVGGAPGNRIFAADFSNIEGRLTAWLAGEDWKLQAFRDFDAGVGHDIYHITAGKVLGKDPGPVSAPTITDEERQGSGKVPELALGYQGGVGAFQNMAKIYGVVVSDERADEIKKAWRLEHPMTVQLWGDLEDAAVSAITQPGKTFYAGFADRIAFRVAGTFMYMRLPSGRAICYPFPCMKRKLMPWTKAGKFLRFEHDHESDEMIEIFEQLPVWKDSICYKGIDTYTRQWSDQFAHGGLLANNAVQGTARDIEAEAMFRVEPTYPIVLTVHDEIVSETTADSGSVEDFQKLMVELPGWAAGLPLAAGAWTDTRYRK